MNPFDYVSNGDEGNSREPLSLDEMLEQLLSNSLSVILVPPEEEKHNGHKIRVAESYNCEWYRAFVKQYKNCRGIGMKQMKRPRTYINKAHTIKALRRMIKGDMRGIYAERILNFMDKYFKQKDIPF